MLNRLPYLSLSEAAEYCNCTESQLLRMAEKGLDHIELLYTVDYEEMGFGSDKLSLDSGDTEHFLAIPPINAKELFHKGVTFVQTFLVSETSGWTATMLDITQRLSPADNRDSVKTITCNSEWIVKKEDLYIMRKPLDTIRLQSASQTISSATSPEKITIEKSEEGDELKYPLELQAALAANREFTIGIKVTKPRETIAKYIAEWFAIRGLGLMETSTGNRIAELITCREISIVLKAWEVVYGQEKESSRGDMEKYLEMELGLKTSSVRFRRIAAVTTPDNCKPHNVRHQK